VCGACYDVCDGANACGGGSDLGCSAQSLDCGDCANSDCALIDSCGFEYDTCTSNPDCIALNTCYNNCG
jgi:hypothetical protein